MSLAFSAARKQPFRPSDCRLYDAFHEPFRKVVKAPEDNAEAAQEQVCMQALHAPCHSVLADVNAVKLFTHCLQRWCLPKPLGPSVPVC